MIIWKITLSEILSNLFKNDLAKVSGRLILNREIRLLNYVIKHHTNFCNNQKMMLSRILNSWSWQWKRSCWLWWLKCCRISSQNILLSRIQTNFSVCLECPASFVLWSCVKQTSHFVFLTTSPSEQYKHYDDVGRSNLIAHSKLEI